MPYVEKGKPESRRGRAGTRDRIDVGSCDVERIVIKALRDEGLLPPDAEDVCGDFCGPYDDWGGRQYVDFSSLVVRFFNPDKEGR